LTHAKKLSFPVLLINATFDFHLQRDAKDLFEALKKQGTDVDYRIVEGTTHGSIIRRIGKEKDNISVHWFDFFDKISSLKTE